MTEIIRVDLTRNLELEPVQTYRIDTGEYKVAALEDDPLRPHLTTGGLTTCRAVTFYHPGKHRGLMAHIGMIKSPARIISRLAKEFGLPLNESEASVVSGSTQGEARNFRSWGWSTVDELVWAIRAHRPRVLLVDDQEAVRARGVALDLRTGHLKGLALSVDWIWNTTLSTEENKRVAELEA